MMDGHYTPRDFRCNSVYAANYSWSGAVTTNDIGNVGTEDPDPNAGIWFFQDANLTKHIGTESGDVYYESTPITATYFNAMSPFYFGTWAFNFPDSYGKPWDLKCKTHVLNLDYHWMNGSISQLTNISDAQANIGAAVYAPFAAGLAKVPLADIAELTGNLISEAYQDGGAAAAVVGPEDVFPNQFSEAAISLVLSVMSPRANLLEQRRLQIELARIPLVPLYMLLSLKPFYVFATLALAVAALSLTRLQDAHVVKDHLSLDALVSACLEPGDQKTKALHAAEVAIPTEKPGKQTHSSAVAAPSKVGLISDGKGGWEYAALVGGMLTSFSALVKPWVQPEVNQIL